MKIKQVYEIDLKDSNCSVYKLGQLESKIKIDKVNVKKEHKYIEIEFSTPKVNTSLIRNKTDTMTMYAHGHTSVSNYYYVSASNAKEALRINTFYKFNNKFHQTEDTKNEIQFRKVESREEIEHRKNNINYKIKNMDKEPFVTCTYGSKVQNKKAENDAHNAEQDNGLHIGVYDETTKNSIQNIGHDTTFNSTTDIRSSVTQPINNNTGITREMNDKSIDTAIHNKIVVNYSDLVQLYRGNVKDSLLRNTFAFKGRYILKHKFYSKVLQPIREDILSKFEHSDTICIDDNNMSEDYASCLNELCTRTNNYYKLKGHYESVVLDYKDSSLNTILRDKILVTIQEIRDIGHLDGEEVYQFINDNNIVQLPKNYFCVVIIPEIECVLSLLDKSSIHKQTANDMILAKRLCPDTFYKVLEKYYVLKKAQWTRLN